MTTVKDNFDYEQKLWGSADLSTNPKSLGSTRLKYCLDALKNIKSGKILDLGCGGGAFSRAIKKYRPALLLTGCDISQKALTYASGIGGNVSYIHANVYKLPFANESFSAIVSFDVFEHLSNPQKAFLESARVLKNKGIFHFFVPCEGNGLSLYQLLPKIFYNTKRDYTGHIARYTYKEIQKLLNKSGFKIIKYRYSCYFIYQLADLFYFSLLKLRGGNVKISVEGYLKKSNRTIFDNMFLLTKNLFGYITYYENELFYKFPGGGIHVTAVKV